MIYTATININSVPGTWYCIIPGMSLQREKIYTRTYYIPGTGSIVAVKRTTIQSVQIGLLPTCNY